MKTKKMSRTELARCLARVHDETIAKCGGVVEVSAWGKITVAERLAWLAVAAAAEQALAPAKKASTTPKRRS